MRSPRPRATLQLHVSLNELINKTAAVMTRAQQVLVICFQAGGCSLYNQVGHRGCGASAQVSQVLLMNKYDIICQNDVERVGRSEQTCVLVHLRNGGNSKAKTSQVAPKHSASCLVISFR